MRLLGRGSPAGLLLFLFIAWVPSAPAQVVINEVLAANRHTNTDEDGDSSDWLELHNPGPSTADLTGYSLTDDAENLRRWIFPDVSMEPGSYLLVWCSGKDRTTVQQERLTEPNSPLLFTPGLISLEDDWRYLTSLPETPGPAPDWKSPGFDDSGWTGGKAGFGFGAAEGIRTPVAPGAGALFLRRTFAFRPGQPNLILQVRFDDGFAAYLNGDRVAASGFPEAEEPTFASRSNRSHSVLTVERFDLSPFLGLLRPEGNVLAIVLLNFNPTSNDMLLFPELGSVPPVFHANFSLSTSGEAVALVEPAGEVQDVVFLPEQTPDHSYGRSPNGSGVFLYHRTPTPLARNEGPAAEQPLLVADTKFNPDRGFHDAPVDVEVTTATAAAAIRYTLDGSEPTETNGLLYEGPIHIERTTTLRARAFKPGHEPTNVDTHTYIFLDDVLTQSSQGAVDAGFPRTWGGAAADYEMDREIVGPGDRYGGLYAGTIRDDLRSLPTLSIVLNKDDMFGPRGIYSNSTQGGIAWERPASVELISPDGGAEFQENCGIRIQGGYFRQASATPKHSFRLLFKSIYGAAKLRFPLFGRGAAESFDTLTLRAGANDGYSWDAARLTEQYTRDEFGRELQRATGRAGAHGVFVHLYIDGLYWGLYNPAERPDHSFSATYYGGDKDDWDAVHDLQATNGNMSAWGEMLRKATAARDSLAAFQELQGLNPDGTRNPDFPHLLDVPNYADYLVVNLWGGNWDWPWKNWWAGRDRSENSTGFKFYCWDYENTMGNNRDRSPLTKNALQNNFTQAGEVHVQLRSNPEYRLLFADRVHHSLFNGGPLTPAALIPRYEALAAKVEGAIVGESARWGDQHFNPPLTLREWRNERDWMLGTYLPQRTAIVLGQFRGAGLYPPVEAPTFQTHGGIVPAGFRALPHAPEGVVFYTTDGTDPRLPGGEVSPAALVAVPGRSVTLVPVDAAVRLHVPGDDGLGLDWTAVEFDDAGWSAGRMAVGYETETGYEGLIATDVGPVMNGVNASIYLRVSFEVEDPSSLAFLRLQMRYDDGYVAYLNGVRAAERNARPAVAWNSAAATGHSDAAAVVFEGVDLGEPSRWLRPGRNVLAIHGFNLRAADADFLIQPELVAIDPAGAGVAIDRSARVRARAQAEGGWSALNEATFIIDTGIPLRVTEIMYHPPAPPPGSRHDVDEFEFLEIKNTGSAPVDLAEVRLRGGVEFEFAGSEVETLGPGEILLLVENLNAFRTRYAPEGLRVAGEYRGKLANDGDDLVLEGYLGEPILEFEYDDGWYPETDGGGRSLVMLDPSLPREAWNDWTNWGSSLRSGGSPGADEADGGAGGRQRQGDASQDGRLGVIDAILLVGALFSQEPTPLPCAGGSIASGGNLELHDLDASGGVNLTDMLVLLNYLFHQGPPPALGTGCVRIEGCPDACGA